MLRRVWRLPLAFAISACFAANADATGHEHADNVGLIQQGQLQAPPGFGGPPIEMPTYQTYRVVVTATHGSDHACLTEMEFFDQFTQRLTPRFVYMSSCYGCAVSCDSCAAKWGNPAAQFDLVTVQDDDAAWSCTAPGTFPGGVGEEYIAFALAHRPVKGILHSANAAGAWLPKSWKLQEEQSDKSWQTIGVTMDAEQASEMPFFMQRFGSFERPPLWPVDFDKCSGLESPDPHDVFPDDNMLRLSATFTAQPNRALANNGMPGVKDGMAIDGDFGTIRISGATYQIRQLLLVFPSNRRVRDVTDKAEGELHVIAQRDGSTGLFDPAVFVVLLELPTEGSPTGPSEMFFKYLGAEELPPEGFPKALKVPVDLQALAPAFAGPVMTWKCSDKVPWYVLTTPAHVTGSVVMSFKSGPVAPDMEALNQTILAAADGDAHLASDPLEVADVVTTTTRKRIVWGAGGVAVE